MKNLIIELNNTKGHLIGESPGIHKLIGKLRSVLRYRNPNQFYIRPYIKKPHWDGYDYSVTEAGYFFTGTLPRVLSLLDEWGISYDIDDQRKIPSMPDGSLGTLNKKIPSEYTLDREYQISCVSSVINHYVGGVYFPRGLINAAPNAGKTLIMILIHLSYKDINTLVLLKDSTLFNQFLKDFPKVFKAGAWGYIRGKEIHWGKITVAMVPTLVNHLDEFKERLEKVDAVLVDECDLAKNKSYKAVLSRVYNATIRVGLSGTIFKRKLAKDRPKIEFLKSFFGEELFIISTKELTDMGYSCPIIIKINKGNSFEPRSQDYDGVYKESIVNNLQRNQAILSRVKFYAVRGKSPILVVCRLHEHVRVLYDLIHKSLGLDYTIDYVHNDRPGKEKVIEDFRNGDTDILISSQLIKRGQNMPLIKAIINAGGGDGPEVALQIIGRGLRVHESKTKTYYEDFYDKGKFLERHSKHRYSYYQGEGHKIIRLI